MMKRFLAFLLALLLLLPAAGCARLERMVEESRRAQEPTPAPTEQVQPTPEPTPEPRPEPTPDPRIVLPPLPDIDINSWEFLYAGPHQGVKDFKPELANVEWQNTDIRCAQATLDFLAAARSQGFTVYICSAYRNWEYTTFWYDRAMNAYGSSYEAAQHVFAPGCSEHSTGLAFDITDEQYYEADHNYNNEHDETVAGTPVCQWMDEHCADFGFIVRYPENKREVYGMACYPGHYRYVGQEAAHYIMDNGLCFEEFLALYGKTIRGVNYVNEYVVREN